MGRRSERRREAERDAARRAGEASAAAASDGIVPSESTGRSADAPADTATTREAGTLAGAGAAAAAAADSGDAAQSWSGESGESGHAPRPALPPDLTAAAFFDVDNTMMMGASIFYFARGLASRNFLSGADMRGFVWQQVRFRLGGEGTPESIRAHREQALSFVAGRSVAELVELGEDIYDELMADRIWDGTRSLAQMHLDAGQRVWLVTATPLELARIIARRLGLTGALGTVAESEDGVYTGRLVGELLHGAAKAHAVRALAAREGLDLRRCAAYSDSINDAPMLSVVGTAVAVNPDAELRTLARERGWEIREFRSGRRVARIGLPSVLGAGAVAGAVAAGAAYRRRVAS